MKIPGIYSPSTQGPQRPEQTTYAVMAHFFTQTSKLASAVSAVSAPAPADPNSQWNSTTQALADLAAIDMILRRMASGQIDPATGQAQINQYMNDLLNNCAGNTLIDSLISSIKGDFTLTNGNWVPIMSGSSTSYLNCKFEWDWDQPTGATNSDGWTSAGGIATIWNLLSQKPSPVPPGFTIGTSNPMALADLLLFASDSLLCPTVANSGNIDQLLFGTSYGLPPNMDFANLLPILIAAGIYQQDSSKGVVQFMTDMRGFLKLFPTQADFNQQYGNNPMPPNYSRLLGNFDTLLQTDFTDFPPASWASILGPNYLGLFGITGNTPPPFGTPLDMTFFYNEIETYPLQVFAGNQ